MSGTMPDMGAISQLLGSLSEDDIENLKSVASSMFSSSEKPPEEEKKSANDFDLSSLMKIASIMNAINSEKKDPRCDLLMALRPMVAKERQQKIDQAVKMLRLAAVFKAIGFNS